MTHESIGIIRDEHTALAAMLRSLGMMVERGPGNEPENFFGVLRAMLFYIDDVSRVTLPSFRVALSPTITRPFCAVPRTSVARTASG